ncbi:HNH endonuclease [candidate division WOR-3 bacterium]|jgi:hypothetical protein|nr:HNH endonuclease [Candidatus Parcubacteria bacterium]MCK4525752.1 HNH endonuclease [candidate division WOR-3 bacterium]
MVYVLNRYGEALMPCSSKKAKTLLKNGKAVVVNRAPYTIGLIYGSSKYKQPITLGIDSGYTYIGFSAVTETKELIGGELTLLKGISERLTKRKMYRKHRRNRLRFRKPGFLKTVNGPGWLAPSIRHKLDSHVRFIEKIKQLLPITRTIVEVANFDIQKIKNPEIKNKDYQNGEQKGFSDVREYVLHRDGHKCQNPNCKGNCIILEVHHVNYWKGDRSNKPSSLITLGTLCHTPKDHQKNGYLYGWKPKLKSFREATFMSMIRWKLIDRLQCEHTYGVQTKFKRKQLNMEKSHHNDAFVIADGTDQKRHDGIQVIQKRKNNRCLEKFYDAKYIDLRDGKKKSGKELSSQKRTRSRENLPESLRKYRAHKVFKGRRSIRKQRYSIQPKDIVEYQDNLYSAVGTHSKGKSLMLTDGLKKFNRSMKQIKLVFHQKTFVFDSFHGGHS